MSYFTNKGTSNKVILIEKEKITNNSNEVIKEDTLLVNNEKVAKTFNKHFAETVETLILLNGPRIAQIY